MLKKIHITTIACFAGMLLISGVILQAQDGAAAAAPPAESAAPAMTPAQKKEALEALGWLVGARAQLNVNFTDEELASVLAGVEKAARGAPEPENLEAVFPIIRTIMEERIAAKQDADAVGNRTKGEAFVAAIATKDSIKKTESGLHYEVIKAGEGKKPAAGDRVKVHYHGTLIDGTVFDSSTERGEPAVFPLDGVIPGFSEGLALTALGGKTRLFIPADLGYGNAEQGPIPAGSTLIFEIELLEINPAPEAPPGFNPTAP